MTIPPFILSRLNQWVPAHSRHLIEPGATLEGTLRLDALVPLDLSEAFIDEFGREVPDAEIERWETVGDVVRTAERFAADAGTNVPTTMIKMRAA